MRAIVTTLSEAMLDYRDARSARYADSTWEAHERQLEKFRDWVAKPSELGANPMLRDVDERTMVRYFNRLRPPVNAGSTFNNYRQYMNQFFRFCVNEGWLDRHPMRHVDPALVVRRPRLQLSAQEMLMALDGASPRDRIGLALGMNTALRASDVMTLKVSSPNLSNNTLTAFIQKTQKWDELPISAELRVEIIRWFQQYAQDMDLADWHDLPSDWTLVPPGHYQAVNVWRPDLGGRNVWKTSGTYTNPQEIVHRALQRLGYPTKGEGFHTLRRSALRRFYDLAMAEGVADPMRMPQALAGHKRRETTEIYLGMTIEREMRDDLLRGKSFLRRQADDEIAARGDDNDDDGLGGVLARRVG